MQETNKLLQTLGSLPSNYQEVLNWKASEKRIQVILIQFFGILLFIVFGLIFSFLAFSLGKLPTTGEFGIGISVLIFVVVLFAFILHELTHAFAMKIFGAKPIYGILWKSLMFYATSPGYSFRRNQYVVIALAPFIILSVLFIMGMWVLQGTFLVALIGICAVFNASGAVADLWITAIVLRYPKIAYVQDERDGIRVYLPK
jgi:hypothetical protein